MILTDPGGKSLALALADPGQRAVARVVDRPGGSFKVRERARAAVARRSALLQSEHTDVYRLVHGEADGLPGLHVDRYGETLVAVRRAPCAAPWCRAVYDVLLDACGIDQLWEKDHLDDIRRSEVVGRPLNGHPTGPYTVLERGLRFQVSPFDGLATGLYPDQRTNRESLAQRGPFRHALNLFSYTGAFSVALLAAGTERVTEVDISAAALRVAALNHEINGLDPGRRARRVDAMRFVKGQPEGAHDLVILDPPTSARGAGGWSASRGYPELLDQALRVLEPGGTLLACLNRRRPVKLGRLVEQRIASCGRRLVALTEAPPAPDHPRRRGFAEGTTFHGVLAVVE